MSHSAEQCRKKEEAMRDAEHQEEHSTVDGSMKRASHVSHAAHMGNNYERSMEEGK